jgi:PAS domain S-box-containing protein
MIDLGPMFPALLEALERAGIGVVTFRQRGSGGLEKLYGNEPAMRSVGYTLEEWLEKPPLEVVSADQRPTIAQLYERLVVGAAPPAALEVALVHRDGHLVRSEWAVARGESQDARVLVMVARDPSTESRARLSLLEADRIGLVGALAAGFAHETNNPLTSVLLNLRSLRKQVIAHVEPSAQQVALRCLDDITTGAERIASNVRALQTLATRSATAEIDLAAIVSAALRLAAPTLEPRAHVIRQIFPVRAVVGEEARIGQAVLAMLLFSCSGFPADLASEPAGSNTPGDRIVVAVEERDGGVVIEVSDNGRELTPQEVEHAFDPFFRSSVRGAGVGVGLGIARSVAMTLGGEVSLSHGSAGGAVITMWLPAAPKES